MIFLPQAVLGRFEEKDCDLVGKIFAANLAAGVQGVIPAETVQAEAALMQMRQFKAAAQKIRRQSDDRMTASAMLRLVMTPQMSARRGTPVPPTTMAAECPCRFMRSKTRLSRSVSRARI